MKKFLIAALAAMTLSTGVSADAFARDRDGRIAEPAIDRLVENGIVEIRDHPRDDRRHDRDRGRHDRDWGRHDILTPREIARSVRSQGYRHIYEIDRVRRDYRVEAVRNNGRVFRLWVDGRTGRVLDRDFIGWAGRPGHGRGGIGFSFTIR